MWRKMDYYPNYEIDTDGVVRNIKTQKVLKDRKDGSGYAIVFVTNKHNVKQWVTINDMLSMCFTNEEILGEIVIDKEPDLEPEPETITQKPKCVFCKKNLRTKKYHKKCLEEFELCQFIQIMDEKYDTNVYVSYQIIKNKK